AVIEDLGLEFSEPWTDVVDTSRGPEWARWFVGGKLNLAWNCVHRWAAGELAEEEAAVWQPEDGSRTALTWRELSDAVYRLADEALQGAPAVAHTVVWRRLELDDVPMTIGRDRWWEDLVADTSGGLSPRQVDSEHPYLLAYTSGTTGKPKGALHVHGGFLASIAREVAYQTDVKPGDRIHFATDMGWIMGPWTVVGGGACGATVVYAEGAPDFPPDRLWRLVETERVTMLGVSPTLVRALIPHGDPTVDMSSLKAICTTGEPWNRDPYLWLSEHVGGGRVPTVHESGG